LGIASKDAAALIEEQQEGHNGKHYATGDE
jgi:hypothetical protein